MSKTIGIIIGAVIILGAIYYFATRTPSTTDVNTISSNTTDNMGDQNTNNEESNGSTNSTTSATTAAKGRVVFSVTDATLNIADISEITMKISKVELHSAANGWVTVSTAPHSYNLLALNSSKQLLLLADSKVRAGTYDQVRIQIDSVTVKPRTGAAKTAKLPSNSFASSTKLIVAANDTSTLKFDFQAKPSLHISTIGDYIFTPVLHTETESSVTLKINSGGAVVIDSGRVDNVANVGMDIDGSVKSMFEVSSTAKLSVSTDGKIKIEQ